MKTVLKAALIALGVLGAGAAQAANAISTANLNIRTGPGAGYASRGAIPNGAPITVHGCTSGYGWCQVSYGSVYGWSSSRYIAIKEGRSGGYSNNFGNSAAMIGIPLIAGAVIGAAINDRNDRWDRRHWRSHDRRWNRGHWRHRDRGWDRPRWHGRDSGWRDGRRIYRAR